MPQTETEILSRLIVNIQELQQNDHETLIQIGSSLEDILPKLTSRDAADLLQLCLQALQLIYQGEISNFNYAKKIISKALQAIVRSLQVDEGDNAELPQISEAGKALNELLTPQNDDNTEKQLTSTRQEYSLDDIAAQLLQLDPSDQKEFAALQSAVVKLTDDDSFPENVREILSRVANLLQEIASGEAEQAEAIYDKANQLIEEAFNILAENELLSSTGTRQGEETQTQKISADNGSSNTATTVASTGRDTKPSSPAASAPDSTPEDGSKDIKFDALPVDADFGLVNDFIAESLDLIEHAERALLTLEKKPDDKEAVNIVFRAFHTVKGTSAFLGLSSVSEFAHRAESYYSRIRDGEIYCTGKYADLALSAVDMLKELIQKVEQALKGEPLTKPENFDKLINYLIEPESFDNTTISTKDLQEDSPAEKEATVEGTSSSSSKLKGGKKQQKKISESTVRVRTDQLDRLLDMVGELVIAQSMVAQDEVVNKSINVNLLKKVMHANKIVRDLQDLSMLMRMVPLKPTFNKMARVVRDAARKSNKEIEFITQGEDVEIDRNMVDVINDPLVHILRNAVDHGVESREERKKLGKPVQGKIQLNAYHAGGNVIVEIKDDGRGLSREKIINKALDKGLIDSAQNLSEQEIYHLIFEPGFSTADRVTEVSGRGVGLDVVKKGVEALRGRVEIISEVNRGTTFILRFPLTMAITDGMQVKVGRQRYIIPTINIHLNFRPTRESLFTIAGRGEMVMLRDKLLPIFRLHRLFHIPESVEDPTRGLLVVLDDGNSQCALLVDELLGQQQVVVKSLGESIGKVRGISGGAILGDGRVGLILDPAEIVTLARQTDI